MPVRTDQAIVLRLSDYSETSQIVSLFTARSGLVRLIAKGSRRGTRQRFAAGLDLLEYGEVSYAPPRGDAGLGTLTEWVQRDAFGGLRGELLPQYAALYAVELVGVATEEYDRHPGLFEALLQLLSELAQGTRDAERPADEAARRVAALVRFQAALLKAIGYLPELERCVSCGRPRARGRPAYFSSNAGGLVCRDCEMHFAEKRRVSAGLLDALAGPRGDMEWFALFDYHLTHVVGRPFKTATRLRALLGLGPAGGSSGPRPDS
jgi:DNA repair protein RecO (recombination protein O)